MNASTDLSPHRNGSGGICPADGWHAELTLRFAPRRGRTILVDRHQRGPLLVLRPFYPEADGVCHTYVLHPPAGIVGGDQLMLTCDLDEGAHALITTPAATRWYFSRGAQAQVDQRARVGAGASLEWLPQETLLFDGAHARLTTRIELDAAARFCGWEILGLGRPASHQPFRSGRIDFRFEIVRDRQPLLLERLRGDGGLPGLRGHAACATFIATPASSQLIDAVRDVLSGASAALCAGTLIGDVLVARGVAARCEPLITTFTALWSRVRPLLLGRPAVPPRIWRT
jgi:urease accessory protein